MLATKISARNRKRKYDLFLEKISPQKTDKILDVGFNNMEYSYVDNFLEKTYPYLDNITALGIEDGALFRKRYPLVNTIIYDGKKYPFEDNRFDIGWSNAVLEHVGDENAQILFLKEIRRTCKRIYLTTPNRYFPFEVYTRYPLIHWLPKRYFDKILQHTSKKWASGEYMNLLSGKKLEYLLKEAGIKNYKIYKNRFLGFTMDFSVVII